MSKNYLKFASFIVRWGSLALMAFALYFFASSTFFWIRADSITGIVANLEQMEKLRNQTIRQAQYQKSAYAPYITFTTDDDEEVTFLSNVGYGEDLAFNKGDKVPVLYLRSDPQTAKINSLLELFVLPIVLFVFGGIFWIVGIVLQFMAEPTNKSKSRTNV